MKWFPLMLLEKIWITLAGSKFLYLIYNSFDLLIITSSCLFYRLPLWVLIITPTVYFLNCLNCSFNFVIYCIMYSAFRRELYSKANKLGLKMKKFWNNIKNPIINSISKDPSFQQPQRSKNLIEMDNITLKNDVVWCQKLNVHILYYLWNNLLLTVALSLQGFNTVHSVLRFCHRLRLIF